MHEISTQNDTHILHIHFLVSSIRGFIIIILANMFLQWHVYFLKKREIMNPKKEKEWRWDQLLYSSWPRLVFPVTNYRFQCRTHTFFDYVCIKKHTRSKKNWNDSNTYILINAWSKNFLNSTKVGTSNEPLWHWTKIVRGFSTTFVGAQCLLYNLEFESTQGFHKWDKKYLMVVKRKQIEV